MSETDNGQTIAAAETSQVKFFPIGEEEPAIWFRLIKAQFAAAVIKSQTKILGKPMLLPASPSRSFGTFWTQ
jgi:hypothetical protein